MITRISFNSSLKDTVRVVDVGANRQTAFQFLIKGYRKCVLRGVWVLNLSIPH